MIGYDRDRLGYQAGQIADEEEAFHDWCLDVGEDPDDPDAWAQWQDCAA